MESSELTRSLQQLQGAPLDELQRQIARGELSDELRDVLGDQMAAELEGYAQVSSPPVLADHDRPLVIVLPGIIGSSLMNVIGDVGTIWLNPLALLGGKLRYLALDAEGRRDASALIQIVASGLLPTHYLPIQLYLKTLGGCDVLGFPYDWRRSPDVAAEALRELVMGQFSQLGRRVHLVGHSMGGLVARNFCLRYPTEAAQAVAQVIQLGTPNYGSCEPIRNMTVGSETSQLAEKLNSANAPLEVMRSCPGLYAMLPVPADLYPADAPFPYPYNGDLAPYDAAGYGIAQISAAHLQAAHEGYTWLKQAGPMPVPVTIIAGYGVPTCQGVSHVDGTAGLDFAGCTSEDGDGTVPLALAVALPGATRLYGRGLKHGDLPRYPIVMGAVRSLIQGEAPAGLETHPNAMVLGDTPEGAQPVTPEQPVPGTLGEGELDLVAARIRGGQATPEDVQVLAGVW
jgi:pimeloyl-ACP methyl ester carboxylesterase